MNKFFEWFGRNRKTIGYTVGVVNILGGMAALGNSNLFDGVVFLLLGAAVIFDAKMFK